MPSRKEKVEYREGIISSLVSERKPLEDALDAAKAERDAAYFLLKASEAAAEWRAKVEAHVQAERSLALKKGEIRTAREDLLRARALPSCKKCRGRGEYRKPTIGGIFVEVVGCSCLLPLEKKEAIL